MVYFIVMIIKLIMRVIAIGVTIALKVALFLAKKVLRMVAPSFISTGYLVRMRGILLQQFRRLIFWLNAARAVLCAQTRS